jgi:hypothetical protein
MPCLWSSSFIKKENFDKFHLYEQKWLVLKEKNLMPKSRGWRGVNPCLQAKRRKKKKEKLLNVT